MKEIDLGVELTTQLLDEMPFMNQVVKEALRHSPPGVISLPYKTFETTKIGQVEIPANIEVKFNVYGAHRNPK